MDEIIIIGASGHGRVCLDYLLEQNRIVLGFFDDDPDKIGKDINGYPVLGDCNSAIPLINKEGTEYFLGVGSNNVRRTLQNLIMQCCNRLPTNIIHHSSHVSSFAKLGSGNFVGPFVVLKADTAIGNNTIINSGVMVGEDVTIFDFAQISPGCVITGNVTIEESAFLGAGAVVIPGKTIGAHAIIGAGAVVTQNIPPYCTAVGIPAQVIKQRPVPEK